MQILVSKLLDVQEKAETIDKNRADAYAWTIRYIVNEGLLSTDREQIEEAYDEGWDKGFYKKSFNAGKLYYQQKYGDEKPGT